MTQYRIHVYPWGNKDFSVKRIVIKQILTNIYLESNEPEKKNIPQTLLEPTGKL